MKIFEVIEAKKLPKQDDELDDIVDKPEDPDSDKVPHILMQIRKAIDVEGDHPITFKDGKKVKLSFEDLVKFVKKYIKSKPDEKEKLQTMASLSLDGFKSALKHEFQKTEIPKIKGTRYMSGFAGDFDDK